MTYIESLILSFFDMFMLLYIIMSLKTSLQKNDFIKGIFGVIAGAVLASVSGYYISNQAISFTVNIMIAFLIIQIIMNCILFYY